MRLRQRAQQRAARQPPVRAVLRAGPVHRERPAGVGRESVARSAELVARPGVQLVARLGVQLVVRLEVLLAAQLAGLARQAAAEARPGVAARLAGQAVVQPAAVERPAVRRLAQPEAPRLAVPAARVDAAAHPAAPQAEVRPDVDGIRAAGQPGAVAFAAAGGDGGGGGAAGLAAGGGGGGAAGLAAGGGGGAGRAAGGGGGAAFFFSSSICAGVSGGGGAACAIICAVSRGRACAAVNGASGAAAKAGAAAHTAPIAVQASSIDLAECMFEILRVGAQQRAAMIAVPRLNCD